MVILTVAWFLNNNTYFFKYIMVFGIFMKKKLHLSKLIIEVSFKQLHSNLCAQYQKAMHGSVHVFLKLSNST